MSTGKRLTYYIEKQGFTKKQFCDKFYFEYNNLTGVLADKRALGINVLNKLHEALPRLNMHWVLYGEGPEEFFKYDESLVKESTEVYYSNNSNFGNLLLNELDNETIKNKIYEIIKEKSN